MKHKLLLLLLIAVTVSVFAQDDEKTPIQLQLSLDACLNRLESHSLQSVYTKLRMEKIDIDNDPDWWKSFIQDINYNFNFDAEIATITQGTTPGPYYDYNTSENVSGDAVTRHDRLNHNVSLTAPLFSSTILDSLKELENNKLQKERIMSQFRTQYRYSVRYWYSDIVFQTEEASQYEQLLSELQDLKKKSFGLPESLDSWMKTEIDRKILEIRDTILRMRHVIKTDKIRLLNLLDYPLNQEITLTDSMDTFSMDFETDLETAIENSGNIKQYLLIKVIQERNLRSANFDMFPRINADVTTEVAEGLTIGLNGQLNYSEDFRINLKAGYIFPEKENKSINGSAVTASPGSDWGDLSSLDFSLSFDYSLNQILNGLELKKRAENDLLQYDQQIKIAIAHIAERLWLFKSDMGFNQQEMVLVTEKQELAGKQMDLMTGGMRISDLDGISTLVSVIYRVQNEIQNNYNNKSNQYDYYWGYLRIVEGSDY